MCETKKNCSCGCSTKKILDESVTKKVKVPINTKNLLFEADLKITESTKKDMIKQTKTAIDSLYTMYSLCESANVKKEVFLNHIDESFAKLNELLTVLVSQKGK